MPSAASQSTSRSARSSTCPTCSYPPSCPKTSSRTSQKARERSRIHRRDCNDDNHEAEPSAPPTGPASPTHSRHRLPLKRRSRTDEPVRPDEYPMPRSAHPRSHECGKTVNGDEFLTVTVTRNCGGQHLTLRLE